MPEKEINQFDALTRDAGAALASPMITSDVVIQTAPSFAVASMMISAAQTQSRAMEANVAHLNQSYLAGLATATQCVTRILEDPSRATLLNAFIAANND
ncbi:MAG: RebB family R body protein [Rhodobacteraceae bacterium]|nr:RebB family R body protein [Paracoccaceae bacterium]